MIFAIVFSFICFGIILLVPNDAKLPVGIILCVIASVIWECVRRGITFQQCPYCLSRNTRKQKGYKIGDSYEYTDVENQRAEIYDNKNRNIGHVDIPTQVTKTATDRIYTYHCKHCGKEFTITK